MQGHTVRSTVKCGTLFWRVRAEDLSIPSPNFSKCYPWGCSVWWLYTWARLLRSSIEFHLQKRLFSTWSKVGGQACLCAVLPASPCLAHHHRKTEACVLWDQLKIPQKSSELAQLESIVLICKVCVWWVVGGGGLCEVLWLAPFESRALSGSITCGQRVTLVELWRFYVNYRTWGWRVPVFKEGRCAGQPGSGTFLIVRRRPCLSWPGYLCPPQIHMLKP